MSSVQWKAAVISLHINVHSSSDVTFKGFINKKKQNIFIPKENKHLKFGDNPFLNVCQSYYQNKSALKYLSSIPLSEGGPFILSGSTKLE